MTDWMRCPKCGAVMIHFLGFMCPSCGYRVPAHTITTTKGTYIENEPPKPNKNFVEVIRCKDCRYDHDCKHEMIRKSKGGGVIYCPVEFCSEGKRKEE